MERVLVQGLDDIGTGHFTNGWRGISWSQAADGMHFFVELEANIHGMEGRLCCELVLFEVEFLLGMRLLKRKEYLEHAVHPR